MSWREGPDRDGTGRAECPGCTGALGVAGPDALAAREVLEEALLDEDEMVRASAARTLGLLGPGAMKALPALLSSLDDDAESVRVAAARSIPLLAPEMETVPP